jgi:hypothetical protein
MVEGHISKCGDRVLHRSSVGAETRTHKRSPLRALGVSVAKMMQADLSILPGAVSAGVYRPPVFPLAQRSKEQLSRTQASGLLPRHQPCRRVDVNGDNPDQKSTYFRLIGELIWTSKMPMQRRTSILLPCY